MIEFWICFILSFFGTNYALPHSIRKLKESNYLARDMYKKVKIFIPTNAGIIVLFTSFLAISITPLFSRLFLRIIDLDIVSTDFSIESISLLLVVSIFSIYGLVDDLVDIGRIPKFVLPLFFSYPLIAVVSPNELWIPFSGHFDLNQNFGWWITYNDLFRVFVIPIYIMVVANLVNMHSGYNGLQSGLSIILLLTITVKTYLDGNFSLIFPIGAFLGGMIAFWRFNRFPARVFEGNIGSLLFGSLIGCVIVIQEYWWFGFFILLPHTFNFILWIYWLVMMRADPSNYLETTGLHQKFGSIRGDGTLNVPNYLTLKWMPNYFFSLNEYQSVLTMYSITLMFCFLGLIIY